MGIYKVPQDVEADDKLLGPFTFRQFIYLLVLSALIAIAFALAKIFIVLAIIPLPAILLFGALALPIKKDQPMETYLIALISFYFKPRTRFWIPGQKEKTIQITAPKITERSLTRDITGQEANNRLSFLANIIDSGGNYIHANNQNLNPAINQQILVESSQAFDMFDNYSSMQFTSLLNTKEQQNRQAIIEKMRNLNKPINNPQKSPPVIIKSSQNSPNLINKEEIHQTKLKTLSNEKDLSIQTIQSQAKNLTEKENDEFFVSLH